MSSTRMPALFLGHGSPMNVLQNNRYTRAWQRLGDIATSESHSRCFSTLVYSWNGSYRDGNAADNP